MESGAKVMVAMLTFGLFAGADLALIRERTLIQTRVAEGRPMHALEQKSSLTRRFSVFAGCILALLAIEILLLIFKDLDGLALAGPQRVTQARHEVTLELGFVVGLLSLMTLNLITSYSRNLTCLFQNQTQVLEQVSRGELNHYVPVASRDEFGLIASHTNHMIDGLKERDQMRGVFGKIMSPEIARKLLEQAEGGFKLGGSRRELVVLFSDIREFTTWTEVTAPETVVEVLNGYFGEMVEIVHAHGGAVDKFIGDGLMAVFGLADPAGAAEQGVKAALAMQVTMARRSREGSLPFQIGIGLHRGEVIAGLVGAPERLEYTVMGDVVNTAARLEGLTRKLDAGVLVSATLRAALTGALAQAPWQAFGPQMLKGKQLTIEVFGLQQAAILALPGVLRPAAP